MIPIAVFASGRGSNFNAVAEAIQDHRLEAEIVAVVSDQPQAPVLKRAQEMGLKTILVPGTPPSSGLSVGERRQVQEEKILKELLPLGPKFIVLAGYMRILTPLLIDSFRCDRGYSRMVNIHPSLLPSFPGVHSYAQAFHHGVKWTGVTVHLVEDSVDSGPICAQEAFSIADCRSEVEVEKRGLSVEHRLLPEALKWILPENFTLEIRSEGRSCVCQN